MAVGVGRRVACGVVSCVLGVGVMSAQASNEFSERGGAYTLAATPVFEHPLQLNKNQTVTCETRNASAGSDPVLHILAPLVSILPAATATQHTEAARNDNVDGGLNARVTFKAPGAARYRLVMRASGPGTAGTADVFCDGALVQSGAPFGGAFKRLVNLNKEEVLQTVPLARGPHAHQLYLLDPDGRIWLQTASGSSESAKLAGFALPSVRALVGSAAGEPSGPVRLVRNDAGLGGHDPDGDTLGSELEADLGTCSVRTDVVGNWECTRSFDLRDTDGDGIRDDLEVLGFLRSAPFQFLPRWGADPRHKDLFIEVDYGAPTPDDDRQIKMHPKLARNIAAIYGDAAESEPTLRLLHAQQIANPDGKPGIGMHFDTGEDPTADAPEADWTLYGNWGGYTLVSAVRVNNEWRRRDAPKIWRSMMAATRRGIFHYALGYLGDGGQAPYDSIAHNMPLSNNDNAVDDDAMRTTAGLASHELGHTLGISHAGGRDIPNDANCKPNYPSVMNYGYSGKGEAQEDGPLQERPDDTGNTPVDPNGQSLRAFYRFPNNFSDGFGRSALNNTALREVHAVADPGSLQGRRYLRDLEKIFDYEVDKAGGHVDWNRDGVFSDGLVRAYANNNGNCEYTRLNRLQLGGLSDGAPALTRLGSRTILIYNDERDRKLHLEYADHDFTCAPKDEGCGAGLKRRSIDKPWNRGMLNLDAHPFIDGTELKLLVVFTTNEGMFETKMTKDFAWSDPVRIPSAPVLDEMSLAGSGSRVQLAYKMTDGFAALKRRAPDGTWEADEPIVDRMGVPIGPLGILSAPGLLEATLLSGTKIIFGAFPVTEKGILRLYIQDPTSHRWIAVDEPAAAPFLGQPWAWHAGETFDRIHSRANAENFLYYDNGRVHAGAPADRDSAQWVIDRVEPPFVRIRSRFVIEPLFEVKYLYIDPVTNNFRIGPFSPNSPNAMWTLEPTDRGYVRIRNRANPALFIHNISGTLVAGPAPNDSFAAQWLITPGAIGSGEPTFGRPALTFELVPAGSPLVGRLRMLYLHRDEEHGNHRPRTRTLEYVKTYRGAIKHVLRDRDFDNDWFYGYGLDALYEEGRDSNLRAVVSTALIKNNEPSPHKIQFRPKADGILDVTYKNFNDWEMLRLQLCFRLKLSTWPTATGFEVNCG